jgi:putative flippase GtrA
LDVVSKVISNRRLARFMVVGGVGFVVDASVLTVLVSFGNMGLYSSRAVSFLLAVSVTWYMNRVWTFQTTDNKRHRQEYVRYILVQVVGALINLGIYVYCIETIPKMADYPVLPLMIGAVVALMFNYLFSRKLVFVKA